MSPSLSNDQITQALALLELSALEFHQVRQAPSVEMAKARLESLKLRAKKAYKKQVLALHPDQNGGDPGKTEQFKLISTFLKELEALQIMVRPRPVPVVARATRTGTVIVDAFGVRIFVKTG